MHFYKWHSINLIPSGALVMTRDDDGKEGSLLEICILGRAIDIVLNLQISKNYFFNARGPCWSRRRKKWYFPNAVELK